MITGCWYPYIKSALKFGVFGTSKKTQVANEPGLKGVL
jgi:hypothetical protein